MTRLFQGFFVVVMLAAFVGCGDDTSKRNSSTQEGDCPDGQRWNPILAKCEDESQQNSSTPEECPEGQRWNPVVAGCEEEDPGENNSDGNNANNGGSNNNAANNTSPNNSTTNGNNSNNSNGNPNNTMLECGKGDLIGKTCAPSGEPLASADVTVSGIDCETGEPFTMTTRTAGDGTFEFMDVPSGRHQLEVNSGSFNNTREVVIQKDLLTDLTSSAEKVCLDQTVEIAVLGGQFDHVEGLLTGLNLTFEEKGNDSDKSGEAIAFLGDLTAMNQYDIIFINCGNWYTGFIPAINPITVPAQQQQQIYNNLRMYVQGGKSLYFSDYAYPFVEKAFPDLIDFYGDDATIGDPMKGFAPQTVAADVMTQDLQTVLSRNTATIVYPHDPMNGIVNNNWVVATAVGGGAEAQLIGDVQLCGNDNCSQPGDTQAASPLLVTYKDPASGGALVYTSFHNERQHTLSDEMELIMRFLIFQL